MLNVCKHLELKNIELTLSLSIEIIKDNVPSLYESETPSFRFDDSNLFSFKWVINKFLKLLSNFRVFGNKSSTPALWEI